jgi:hypothetical protein
MRQLGDAADEYLNGRPFKMKFKSANITAASTSSTTRVQSRSGAATTTRKAKPSNSAVKTRTAATRTTTAVVDIEDYDEGLFAEDSYHDEVDADEIEMSPPRVQLSSMKKTKLPSKPPPKPTPTTDDPESRCFLELQEERAAVRTKSNPRYDLILN